MERWPSGWRRTLGKRVGRKPTQVQILSSPPFIKKQGHTLSSDLVGRGLPWDQNQHVVWQHLSATVQCNIVRLGVKSLNNASVDCAASWIHEADRVARKDRAGGDNGFVWTSRSTERSDVVVHKSSLCGWWLGTQKTDNKYTLLIMIRQCLWQS